MKELKLQLKYDETEKEISLESIDNTLSDLETVGILEMLREYLNSISLLGTV